MKKYLYDYIKYLEEHLKEVTSDSILIKISFFQHERLIHLLVTLFYTILFLVFFTLITITYLFIIPTFIIMVFLICYIIHYFRLENGVQYLYHLYDLKMDSTKIDKKR